MKDGEMPRAMSRQNKLNFFGCFGVIQRKGKLMFRIILFLLFAFTSHQSFAGVKEKEIKHLLKFVATTQCQYERNGDLHNGKEAAAHIKKKYDHYKNKIKTTADFIKYSATKSTMSGKPYLIHCEGKSTVESKLWLEMELKRFRAVSASKDFVKRT